MCPNKNPKIVLPKLSYEIMGILFKVHNGLGPTFLEKYYQRAVEKELKKAELSYQCEFAIELLYDGESIGRYFLDFVIEDKVVLELKAKRSYHPKFFKQVLAYLRSSGLPLAILANFRSERLDYKRIINPDLKNSCEFEQHSN